VHRRARTLGNVVSHLLRAVEAPARRPAPPSKGLTFRLVGVPLAGGVSIQGAGATVRDAFDARPVMESCDQPRMVLCCRTVDQLLGSGVTRAHDQHVHQCRLAAVWA